MLNDVQIDPRDLRHPLGALHYVENLQAKSRELVRQFKGLPEMVAFIAITKNPGTGKDLDRVGLTLLSTDMFGLDDSGSEKRMFSDIIRDFALKSQAVLICLMSEAWTIKATNPDDVALAEEWVRTHDDLSECPLRQDSVILQSEHKGMDPRNQLRIAPITLVGDVRTVGEFQVETASLSDARFANLLP
jgi:hypothetical protein